MLGLYLRPLCFSMYHELRVTCSQFPSYTGICMGTEATLLSRCTTWPDCADATLTGLTGPVTIVDPSTSQYLKALFMPAVNSEFTECPRGTRSVCREGYFPQCLNTTVIS